LAGFLAVLLVAGGVGMVTHIGYYSAHLLSFTAFYLGLYLIHTSGVLVARQPFRVHLMHGSYLAMASLVYSNGPILMLIYILSSLRHNRWLHIGAATLLAITARPLWQAILARENGAITDVGMTLLWQSLNDWRQLFRDPKVGFTQFKAYLGEYLTFESPL